MKLTIKQTKALDFLEDDTTEELLFGGGAGGGKSAFGCYWLIKMCLKYPGTRWIMGRSKLKTLKETTLNTFFDIASIQGVSHTYRYFPGSGKIVFSNKSEILLKDLFQYPSDKNFDELGSLEITGAFVDECNQIVEKAWDILKSRIRYKLDDFGLRPKILGTCNPAKNWVYARFYKPVKKNIKRAFIQSLLTDNPHISKHYKENLLSLDKSSKERLLYGSWEYDDDPASLIQYENITNLFTNDFVPSGKTYISADIARYGTDKTVIMVWSGLRVIRIETMEANKITEAAEKIKKLSKHYSVPLSRIIVDENGLGSGVVDILGCKGFYSQAKPINNAKFDNLKSQCYFKLADLINDDQIYILEAGRFSEGRQIQADIMEELEYVKQKAVDSDQKKGVLKKDKVKELLGRSPDFADALMMRMYYVLKPVRKYKAELT